jgi:Mrp family chromosome partitioning ATPase
MVGILQGLAAMSGKNLTERSTVTAGLAREEPCADL